MADKPLLEVKDLVIHYETDDGVVKALNGVNIHIGVGETLGLVGETGAGKTTLAKGIMRLIPNPPGKILGGEVIFEGQDLLKLSTNGMEAIRGRDISMIFQDPMTSLNPVLTVGEQIMEVIENHKGGNPGRAFWRVSPPVFRRYEAEGGHCNRPGLQPQAAHRG